MISNQTAENQSLFFTELELEAPSVIKDSSWASVNNTAAATTDDNDNNLVSQKTDAVVFFPSKMKCLNVCSVLNFYFSLAPSPRLTPAVTMATKTDFIQFIGRCFRCHDNGTMPGRSGVFMSPCRQPPLL